MTIIDDFIKNSLEKKKPIKDSDSAFLTRVPQEVLRKILAYVPASQVVTMASVNQFFKKSLQKTPLWKTLLREHFPFVKIHNQPEKDDPTFWKKAYLRVYTHFYKTINSIDPLLSKCAKAIAVGDLATLQENFAKKRFSFDLLKKSTPEMSTPAFYLPSCSLLEFALYKKDLSVLHFLYKEITKSILGSTQPEQEKMRIIFVTDIAFGFTSKLDFKGVPEEDILSMLIWWGHRDLISKLVSKSKNINACDSRGFTPLLMACGRGDLKTVNLLLAHGADPNITGMRGVTPLEVAALKGHHELIHSLLAKGAEPNTVTIDGVNPLFIGAQSGHLEVVQLLITKGSDVNKAREKDGFTPLLIAAQEGHRKVVQLLITKGAHINEPNKHGETPLAMAALTGHHEVVDLLLEMGADLEKTNSINNTPLFIAASKGHLDVVKSLLARGARVNKSNLTSQTPLFIAAQRGYYEVVELLLSYGAEVNKPDHMDLTPFDTAAQMGHHKVVELLLKHGATIKTLSEVESAHKWAP